VALTSLDPLLSITTGSDVNNKMKWLMDAPTDITTNKQQHFRQVHKYPQGMHHNTSKIYSIITMGSSSPGSLCYLFP
jgi:hypothetical protein